MKGRKEEGKMASPMFPRLHVNDAERGGPRAPPRNKMALYEQLSIPSQRFSSGSASMLPLRPPNGSSLVSSMSSSNGGGHERSVFTQVYNSPAPSFLAEKLHSYSSNGIKLNTMTTSQERKSAKPSNYRSLNAARSLSSTAKPSYFSNFRQFSLRKLGDEDDLRDSSAQLGIASHCSNSLQSKDQTFKQKKGSGLEYIKSGPCMRNQNDENTSQTSQDSLDNSTSIPLSRDRNLIDASSIHLSIARYPESLKKVHSSLNQGNRSCSMHILDSLNSTNSRLHQECVALRDEMVHTESLLMETARDMNKGNTINVRTESCLMLSLGDDNRSPEGHENGVECHEDKIGRSAQVREVDGQGDVSNISMVDSISALAVSTDDVVGVIGEKQFWKARRAIMDQQRVFSAQVFELHRLMKVQKLIARSPNFLLEDNLYAGKPPLNRPQAKKLGYEYVLKPPPHIVKAIDDSPNPNPSTECADENAVTNIQHPSINNDTRKGLVTQPSNQTGDDFLNTAYGVPTTHQQGVGILPTTTPPLGQTCFLPYGMPVMNQSISGSAVDQMIPFPRGAQSKDNHLSIMSSQMSLMISLCLEKFQASKESGVQESTATSPSGRAKGGALPLFPMEPIVQALDQIDQTGEQQTRVIKVVPRNPRLATESAARIFQSIKEERKQYN